jgi:hypothetical protein
MTTPTNYIQTERLNLRTVSAARTVPLSAPSTKADSTINPMTVRHGPAPST